MKNLLIIPTLIISMTIFSCKKTRHCYCKSDETNHVTKLDIARKKEQQTICTALETEGFECKVAY